MLGTVAPLTSGFDFKTPTKNFVNAYGLIAEIPELEYQHDTAATSDGSVAVQLGNVVGCRWHRFRL